MDTPPDSPLVFAVDDDAGLLRLVERALTREGVSVATALSGAAALGWLATHRPDLLLVDLRLPDMDGPELLRRAGQLQPNPPFIVITGQGDERVAVDIMKRGALDYIVKDTQFLDLLPSVVRRALNQIDKDRKLAAAERALQSEHAFGAAILDTCGALIVVLDSAGRVVRFNRAAEQTTGWRLAEIEGRTFFDWFLLPEELPAVKAVFDRLVAGEAHVEHENHIRTRGGQTRLVTWSNAVLRGADGRVEHVIGTGIDITEHRRLEREIIEISEREQRRIGQDLHDGVCQQLAGIEFMSQVLAQTLSGRGRPAAPAENAATIARLVREAIEQIRGVARGLSPVVLESEGLMSALTELAERIRHVFRIECAFECPRPVPVPDNHVATHLYRIAQEAVNNALRHGKATRIELRLARSGGRIVLGIHDNGVGLPAPLPSHRGMGLRIMQYRAGIIGGSLALERRPGGGTSVVCSLRAGAG